MAIEISRYYSNPKFCPRTVRYFWVCWFNESRQRNESLGGGIPFSTILLHLFSFLPLLSLFYYCYLTQVSMSRYSLVQRLISFLSRRFLLKVSSSLLSNCYGAARTIKITTFHSSISLNREPASSDLRRGPQL